MCSGIFTNEVISVNGDQFLIEFIDEFLFKWFYTKRRYFDLKLVQLDDKY